MANDRIGQVIIKAALCCPGDVVVFSDERFNYTIESVEKTGIGGTRHHFNNGTASNAYGPGEYLTVIRRFPSKE